MHMLMRGFASFYFVYLLCRATSMAREVDTYPRSLASKLSLQVSELRLEQHELKASFQPHGLYVHRNTCTKIAAIEDHHLRRFLSLDCLTFLNAYSPCRTKMYFP
jgi:hypothetical protein